MRKQAYQKPELRNENDEIIQAGAFGKNSAFCNATNDGAFDYILNNLEALQRDIDKIYRILRENNITS